MLLAAGQAAGCWRSVEAAAGILGGGRGIASARTGHADAHDHLALPVRLRAWLEGLHDHLVVAGLRALAGLEIDTHPADARRRTEGNVRLILQCLGHEIPEQGCDDGATRRLRTERTWRVVAHVTAQGQIGRETDEPDVI